MKGSGLQCDYEFVLTQYGGGPKVPQAWLKVSSDPLGRKTAKEVAEADAREMSKQGLKAVAEKMPWSGMDVYVINSSMNRIKVPGDLYYVKTSKGIKTVHLKAMNKVPGCVESVVRHVAQR